MNQLTTTLLKEALEAVSAFLDAEAAEDEHLVVIGGSALIALGLVSRTATRDVDVMADVDPVKGLVDPRPLSTTLQEAIQHVAEEFDLDRKWLNTGPADQLRAGLPEGFASRLSSHPIGPRLTLYYPDRVDLIHFKLFAVVDQDAGEVFPMIVNGTLKEMGYGNLIERL